jgi:hypothetical protein
VLAYQASDRQGEGEGRKFVGERGTEKRIERQTDVDSDKE